MTTKQDIKEALIAKIENLRNISDAERNYQISDIVDDLLSSRVAVTIERSEPNTCPVPEYNPEEDGTYIEFLVANNID